MTEFLAVSATLNLYLVYRYLVLHSHFRKTVKLLFLIAEGNVKINKTIDGWEVKEIKQA